MIKPRKFVKIDEIVDGFTCETLAVMLKDLYVSMDEGPVSAGLYQLYYKAEKRLINEGWKVWATYFTQLEGEPATSSLRVEPPVAPDLPF